MPAARRGSKIVVSQSAWTLAACSRTSLASGAYTSMHTTSSVRQRRVRISLVEKWLHQFLGPVVAHQQQHPAFQIVEHREMDLPRATHSSMPTRCTGGRARWRRSYSTARFTIVGTLFQLLRKPILAGRFPCQLNPRANPASALNRTVVTRRPRLRSWRVLHPYPASRALHSAGQ
jgi:hypothetical protein